MLGDCLRRWPDINPTLGQCHVFAAMTLVYNPAKHDTSTQCLTNVGPTSLKIDKTSVPFAKKYTLF